METQTNVDVSAAVEGAIVEAKTAQTSKKNVKAKESKGTAKRGKKTTKSKNATKKQP